MAKQEPPDLNDHRIDKVRQYILRVVKEEYDRLLEVAPSDSATQEMFQLMAQRLEREVNRVIKTYNETNNDNLYIRDYKLDIMPVVASPGLKQVTSGQYIDIELFWYETEFDLKGMVKMKYVCSVNRCRADMRKIDPLTVVIDGVEYDFCPDCFRHFKAFTTQRLKPGRKTKLAAQEWAKFKKNHDARIRRGPSMLINLATEAVRAIDALEQPTQDEIEDFFRTPSEADMEEEE